MVTCAQRDVAEVEESRRDVQIVPECLDNFWIKSDSDAELPRVNYKTNNLSIADWIRVIIQDSTVGSLTGLQLVD